MSSCDEEDMGRSHGVGRQTSAPSTESECFRGMYPSGCTPLKCRPHQTELSSRTTAESSGAMKCETGAGGGQQPGNSFQASGDFAKSNALQICLLGSCL